VASVRLVALFLRIVRIVSSEDEIVAGLNGRDDDGHASPPAGQARQAGPAPGAAGQLRSPMAGPAAAAMLPSMATVADELETEASDAVTAGSRTVVIPGLMTDAGRVLAIWARGRSLRPSSACGISVVLALCAAGWFSAGTRADNFRGAAALWAGYLAVIAGRKMASWPLAGQPHGRGVAVSSASEIAGMRWLALLAWRLSECAIYAGLTAGAAAERWGGVWALGIAVLALVAVRDLMTAMCRPVPSGPDESGEPEPGLLRRGAEMFLTMPAGGRVLLIGVVAPAWGCRAALLALLDWGIIAIGFGLAGQARPPAGSRVTDFEPDAEPDESAGDLSGPATRTRGWLRGRRGRRDDDGADIQTGDRLGGADFGTSGLVVLLRPGWDDDDEPRDGPASAADAGPDAGQDLALDMQPDLVADTLPDLTMGAGPEAVAAQGPEAAAAQGPEAAAAQGPQAAAGSGPDDEAQTMPIEISGALLAAEAEAALAMEAGTAPTSADRRGDTRDSRALALGLSEAGATIIGLRDDGILARQIGRLARGNLLPLPSAVLALAATATQTYLGFRSLPSILILTPPLIMLLAAAGSSHPHAGRLDWLVPAVLLGWQFLYLGAVGLAEAVPGPVVFALGAVLLLRYADLACPGRPVVLVQPVLPGEPTHERGSTLGWEGRMLLIGAGVAVGIGTFAYLALTAYLGVLICAKIATSCLTSCLGLREGDGR
jgi:hypothetical protein